MVLGGQVWGRHRVEVGGEFRGAGDEDCVELLRDTDGKSGDKDATFWGVGDL